MASCLRKTQRVLSIVKALISRGLFTLHGLICIWRVTLVQRNPVYWALAGTFPLMIAETLYTLCKKKDGEWKWICPSVLLYLGTAVPAIWFLELDLMRQRLMIGPPRRYPVLHPNATREVLLLHGQIQIAISLGSEEWCKILEQMLLLVLIVGRWLLPKGEITREQLSQLLLVYIGMAADIIELFEAFKEKTVRENRLLTMIILSLWTGSLSQFTFVVTAAKSKKTRPVVFRTNRQPSATCGKGTKKCCPTEVLSILISVCLQDAPFLVLRMLLIFRYDVLSYTNIFFTAKNTLVLVLQIYRLFVLFSDKPTKPHKDPTAAITVTERTSITSGSLSYSMDSYASGSGSDSYDTDSYGSADYGHRRSKGRHAWLPSHVTGNDFLDGNISRSMEAKGGRSPGRKRRTANVITSNHVTHKIANHYDGDTPGVRTPKSRHDSPKKSGKDVDNSSAGDANNKKRKKGDAREGDSTPNNKRNHHMSPEVEKQVRKIEERNKAPSPLPPPPPPPPPPGETYSGSETGSDDDIIENDGKRRSRNNVGGHPSKPSPKRDASHYRHRNSPQADGRSPKIGRSPKDHHQHGHHHHHLNHHNHQHRHHNTSASSPRKRWKAVKNVRSALTFLDEKGVFRTVVLKPMGDGSSIYVVDNSADERGVESG